jgi:hypothetical protein
MPREGGTSGIRYVKAMLCRWIPLNEQRVQTRRRNDRLALVRKADAVLQAQQIAGIDEPHHLVILSRTLGEDLRRDLLFRAHDAARPSSQANIQEEKDRPARPPTLPLRIDFWK